VTVAKGIGDSKDTSKDESTQGKSRSSDRSEKAMQVVDQLRVKGHVFLPSGRTILTVVGHEGDVFVSIDEEGRSSPYCSCDDFHFRVYNGEIRECYHLMAAKIARDQKTVSVTKFSDDEYELFLDVLLKDVFFRI
jgi:predicted nucleic acid-binding Zn finger protein